MRRFHRLVRLLAVPGDWWQFGCTAANTRFNPNETTIGAGNVGRLVLGAWRLSDGAAVAVRDDRLWQLGGVRRPAVRLGRPGHRARRPVPP
jgi:hypothetical protein